MRPARNAVVWEPGAGPYGCFWGLPLDVEAACRPPAGVSTARNPAGSKIAMPIYYYRYIKQKAAGRGRSPPCGFGFSG